ncbi:MAG: SDR family oxidoreductase [Verrucomicrobiia bacterium]
MNSSLSIQGSIVLVTGANRGIGRALVEVFLDRGAAKVYAAVRNPDSARTLAERFGDRAPVLPLDVTRDETVLAAASAAADVEVVVNNAGVLQGASALDARAIETLKVEMEVNVNGLLRIARAFAPVLKANGGGALVQINSVASLRSFPGFATYAASKAAAYSLTQALRQELAAQGTAVVSVHPGPIATDMAASAGFLDIAEPPELVAESIIEALASGRFRAFPDTMARQFETAYAPFAELIVDRELTEG